MKKFYLILMVCSVLVSCNKDTDGDKVNDKEDKCPDTFGLVEFKGCPDSDEDGIPDKDDDCPDEFGYERYDGCPNNDNMQLLVSECLKSYNISDEEINTILSDHDLTLEQTINYGMCSSLRELIASKRDVNQKERELNDTKKRLGTDRATSYENENAKEINDGYIQAVYRQGNGRQYAVILKGGNNNPTYYLMQVLSGGEINTGGTTKFDHTNHGIQQLWVRHKPFKIEATLFTMKLLDSSKEPFNPDQIFN